MNLESVEKIAEAVLYEGYMLYPYRPSSVKNQQRWNFGVLCPQAYCELQKGSEAWMMQTQCLVKALPSAKLTVKVRFLKLVERSVGKLRHPVRELQGIETPEDPEIERIDRLEVNGQIFEPWQEAVEQELTSMPVHPAALSSLPPLQFTFPAGRRVEYLHDAANQPAGVIVREWERLAGSVEFAAERYSERCSEDVFKITVRVRNLTAFNPDEETARKQALMFSLLSAHTILGIENGEFISLLDPPAGLADQTAHCANIGAWPVLAGEQGKAGAMLSSPIILYDYPQIAAESAGNLFDGTEIDEILTLRILTLTDEEKREMRQSDERARAILERTEKMPEEQFMKLHGALRGLGPALGDEQR
jgi:hypothetical protein